MGGSSAPSHLERGKRKLSGPPARRAQRTDDDRTITDQALAWAAFERVQESKEEEEEATGAASSGYPRRRAAGERR